MSNTNTNSAAYEVEPIDVTPAPLPESEKQVSEPTPEPKKKKLANRLFALLLVACSVAVVFLKICVIDGSSVVKQTLIDTVKALFSADAGKLFGIIPAIADTTGAMGQMAALSLYVLALCLVLTVIFGIVTIISGKLLRVVSFFFSAGFTCYALSILAADGKTLDYICLGLAVVGFLVYFVLAVAKTGKKAWVALVQLALSLAVFVALGLGIVKNADAYKAGLNTIGVSASDIVFLAIVGVLSLSSTIGYIRLQTKKGLALDMVRYIIQLLAALFVCYLVIASKASAKLFLGLAIGAAVVCLLQIIVCVIQIKCSKKKVEVVEEPVPEEPVVEEFVREEYAEALPYEGGPVEGVEIAEEVNPTYVAPPAPVQTAGYDFYNCKSFDPFIAVLSNEERNQFTELFILKYKGVMPEIPDYVVGGENTEFFRKLFIYLGQYRDRIPDSLLAKIYQYAIKR